MPPSDGPICKAVISLPDGFLSIVFPWLSLLVSFSLLHLNTNKGSTYWIAVITILEDKHIINSNKFIQHNTFTTMLKAYKQNKHEKISLA